MGVMLHSCKFEYEWCCFSNRTSSNYSSNFLFDTCFSLEIYIVCLISFHLIFSGSVLLFAPLFHGSISGNTGSGNLSYLPYLLLFAEFPEIPENYFLDLFGGLEHLLFFHLLGIIIPTDFHIFQRD